MSNLAVDQTRVTPDQMLLNADDPLERKMLIAERTFHLQQREAQVLASSDVVPAQFRGKVANCIIAKDIALRLGIGELEVMQSLYVVHGNPAWAAKFKIARINSCGKIKGQLKYRFFGTEGQDDWGCQAYATDAQTGEEIVGPKITMKLAVAEGWTKKQGSKWLTMPEKMLMYRAGSWFGDTNMPEATLGLMSADEAEDVGPRQERDITPLSNTDINETFKPKLVAKEAEEESAAVEREEPTEAPIPKVDEESPAFISLKAELLKTRSAETAEVMLKAPALKRAKASEQERFAEMVAKHIEAINAGMLPE